jgi:hypothetical protein
MRQEMVGLCKAVEIVIEIKRRKRKYIQIAKTLIVREIADLIAKKEVSG